MICLNFLADNIVSNSQAFFKSIFEDPKQKALLDFSEMQFKDNLIERS